MTAQKRDWLILILRSVTATFTQEVAFTQGLPFRKGWLWRGPGGRQPAKAGRQGRAPGGLESRAAGTYRETGPKGSVSPTPSGSWMPGSGIWAWSVTVGSQPRELEEGGGLPWGQEQSRDLLLLLTVLRLGGLTATRVPVPTGRTATRWLSVFTTPFRKGVFCWVSASWTQLIASSDPSACAVFSPVAASLSALRLCGACPREARVLCSVHPPVVALWCGRGGGIVWSSHVLIGCKRLIRVSFTFQKFTYEDSNLKEFMPTKIKQCWAFILSQAPVRAGGRKS